MMASIRKLPSGRYQVQIRRVGLAPLSKTFSKKRLALQFASKVESDTELYRKLGRAAANVPKFFDLCTEYLAHYQGRDPSTAGRLKWWCEFFGDKAATDIDEFLVDEGLLTLQKKSLTGSTINRYKSSLSAIFIFFIRHPLYKRLGFTNPVRKESVTCFKENPAKDKFLNQAEQVSLLRHCKKSGWDRLYLLVLMALTTGARKGELMNLKWSDIDFQARVAILHTTKNGKPRMLPLTQNVVEEMIKFRSQNTLIFASTINPDSSFDIKKQWKKVLQDSGIGKCRFHDLRHTAASNLVRAGRTLFEVGTLLGHSSTIMTARYSHLAISDTQFMVDTVMGELG